ncbi:MAG: gamma-glutamyltransferase [bacterium]
MSIFSKCILIILLPAFLYGASPDPVRGKNGMVVSAHELASLVGVDILKKGGNAVDAAVAVGFALAVTYPSAGNIGGGGFFVISLPNGESTTIDFREKAPAATNAKIFLDETGKFIENLSQTGMTSSGVPGTVAGMIYALQKYGKLSLSEVIQPAIDLAENGFVVGYRMANSINHYNETFNKYKSSKNIFTIDGNKIPDDYVFIQKDLASTLKEIKLNGRDGFYKGKVAELIVKQTEQFNGYISLEDLENYQPVERKPIIGTYKGYKIISMGPPSSGGIAIMQALNILEKLKLEPDSWGSSNYYHKLVETLKYVYADRSKYLGDEDFFPVPKEWLTSKEYAETISNNITDLVIPSDEILPGKYENKESKETTHYNVMDNSGMIVSATVTINSSYGNRIVVDGAGFLMNNEMDDFSAKPGEPNQYGLLGSEANSIQPGKRMLSAMSPTIILKNNKPWLAIGSPGGSTIITVVLQVILNCIEFNMDIQEAIDAPRIHHQWYPDEIVFEKFSLVNDVFNNLTKQGYKFGTQTELGRAEGIIYDFEKKLFFGASDPRGYGKAVGY